MHFYKQKQRINLDMSGDLVLHKRKDLTSCNVKSAAPHRIHGGHAAFVGKGNRIKAAAHALEFIFGPVAALAVCLSPVVLFAVGLLAGWSL